MNLVSAAEKGPILRLEVAEDIAQRLPERLWRNACAGRCFLGDEIRKAFINAKAGNLYVFGHG